MTFLIHRNEPLDDRRRVPIWLVTSDGTTPDTGATSDAANLSINGAAPITATNTLSATSVNSGQYYLELDQSETSVLGSIRVIHNVGSFVQSSELIQVVANDPFEDYMPSNQDRLLQGATASTVTLASAETTLDDYFNGAFIVVQYADGSWAGNLISDYTGADREAQCKNTWALTPTSSSTYVVFPGTPETNLSASTILGISGRINSSVTIANADYSQVTVRPAAVAYSGVTLGINNIAAGNYSGVTLQGVTRVNSSVTPANATYSAVTVRIDPQTYSGVTVGVNDITPNTYSGVTIAGLSAAGNRSVASSLLSTDMGSDRLVQEAFFALRNRVDATGDAAGPSVMTVYQTDDVTSSWTASIGTAPSGGINSINPL